MNDCKTVTLRTRPLKNRMLSFYLDYIYICQSEEQAGTGLQRGNGRES